MRFFKFIAMLMEKVVQPIRANATFFFFMYMLGVVCAWVTLPNTRGAELYKHLYTELLIDVYGICLLLMLIPRKVRRWVRALLYLIIYISSTVDVYCFSQFGSTLTPTMLLLVGETNGREAGEFISTYLSADILFSKTGWVILVLLIHILFTLRRYLPQKWKIQIKEQAERCISQFKWKDKPCKWDGKWLLPAVGTLLTAALIFSGCVVAHNKQATFQLMTRSNIGEVEHALTEKDHAVLYLPVYRMMFSVYANSLAAQQITQLVEASHKAQVDSCTFTSKHIVLIIGESFSKHHSQQYGYAMPTTPRQVRRERTGLLVKFNDVVSPWNLTSFVFKHLFSMYDAGDTGEWCDYPLFPELFRRAGYHVTFITNQFLPKAKEAVYDFSGGFFLNHPVLSSRMFDARNDSVYAYDEQLLPVYDRLKKNNGEHQLTIFHLMGQHVTYKQRSPANRKRWIGHDYDALRPDLNSRQRQVLADYDNAVLYNDSVVDQIIRRFENEEAIVIYVPDHGEECYEGNRGFICRNHSLQIDYDLAKYEFEIPFWIWCSHQYAVRHPNIFNAVVQAKNRRFMTDALPHLLLYLGGIHTKEYQEENNLIGNTYRESRPRILKGTTDYDRLKPQPSSTTRGL